MGNSVIAVGSIFRDKGFPPFRRLMLKLGPTDQDVNLDVDALPHIVSA